PDCLNPKSIEDWQLWRGIFTGSKNPENVLENTFNIYSLDNKGIFTTATVLRALQSVTTNAKFREVRS
ncbi:MAG TPA: hypothetical protein V6C91_16280, partial [Coleofasciculaceae cyanobacterium]